MPEQRLGEGTGLCRRQEGVALSLGTDQTATGSVGQSTGLCGPVTCSEALPEGRKIREAARPCCNTPQQTTAGTVDIAAGSPAPQVSIYEEQVSSFDGSDGNLANPSPSPGEGETLCPPNSPSLAFSLSIAALRTRRHRDVGREAAVLTVVLFTKAGFMGVSPVPVPRTKKAHTARFV